MLKTIIYNLVYVTTHYPLYTLGQVILENHTSPILSPLKTQTTNDSKLLILQIESELIFYRIGLRIIPIFQYIHG